jgi:hypothetical protein
VLIPALFILGSWAAFKFVWNITPEIREKMTSAKSETEEADADSEAESVSESSENN